MNLEFISQCEEIRELFFKTTDNLNIKDKKNQNKSAFYNVMKSNYKFLGVGVTRDVFCPRRSNSAYKIDFSGGEDNKKEVKLFQYLQEIETDLTQIRMPIIYDYTPDYLVIECERLVKPPICSKRLNRTYNSIECKLIEWFEERNIDIEDIHDRNIMFRLIDNKYMPVLCDVAWWEYINI